MPQKPAAPQSTASKRDGVRQHKIRLTAYTADAIASVAERHGISLNAEISRRLQKTLEDDRAVENLLETRTAIGIAKLVASLASELGKLAGFQSTLSIKGSIDWFNDPYAFDIVARGVASLLEAMRPTGEIDLPKRFLGSVSQADAASAADKLVDQFLREFLTGDLRYGAGGDRLEDARADLGELYPRLLQRITPPVANKPKNKRGTK